MKRFATSLLTALAATVAVSAQAPVESRAFYSTNANDATTTKLWGWSKSSSKREVHSNKCLH